MANSSLCLVGGTFDHLHAGHLRLFSAALSECDQLEVWLTSDTLAAHKSRLIQSAETRRNAILDWADENASDRVSVHPLEDAVGPAESRRDATAIVCTSETVAACEAINSSRVEAGLAPLSIIEVEHLTDPSGHALSSSRIRAGEVDREGHLWLGEREQERLQRMPTSLDGELKQPMGDLFKGPESKPQKAILAAMAAAPDLPPKWVGVGDVTVKAMLDAGRIPDLAVIDGMTQRTPWEGAGSIDPAEFDHHLTCVNPPGLLTPDLKRKVREALTNHGNTLLEVEGEEDLAPIVIHLLAPLGSVILYGQPGEGVVLRVTDEAIKERARRILDLFTTEVGE